MLIASGMGCLALQKGLGAIHALAHPLGALHDAHHGLLNAVLMPYVIEFNAPAITDKLNFLGRFLDLPNPSAAGLIEWIYELRETLAVPGTLAGMGVRDIDIDTVARMGVADPCAGGNPVPLDEAALTQILLAARG